MSRGRAGQGLPLTVDSAELRLFKVELPLEVLRPRAAMAAAMQHSLDVKIRGVPASAAAISALTSSMIPITVAPVRMLVLSVAHVEVASATAGPS